jgi:hypothetical protein
MEGEPYEESSEEEADSPAKQSPPQRHSIAPTKPPQSKDAARQRRKYIKRRRYSYSRWTDPQVVVNGVLALAAIAGLLFYYSQFRQQIESTKAATRAADYAEKAIHQSVASTRLDQRAWVAQSEIAGKPELDKPYRIAVRIKNTGKTFAKRYTSVTAARIKQLSDPNPDFEKIVGEESTDATTAGIIPPNGTFMQILEINKGAKMTQENLDELKTPTVIILVFGKLTYWDIFNCEHWTTFCCRAYTDGTFETYGPYNDADENYCP